VLYMFFALLLKLFVYTLNLNKIHYGGTAPSKSYQIDIAPHPSNHDNVGHGLMFQDSTENINTTDLGIDQYRILLPRLITTVKCQKQELIPTAIQVSMVFLGIGNLRTD